MPSYSTPSQLYTSLNGTWLLPIQEQYLAYQATQEQDRELTKVKQLLDHKMATLPSYITAFIKDPSDETMQRNLDSDHLFSELMLDLRSGGEGEISKNNVVQKLASPNFHSHPKIHRGYYDSKVKGVVYVKDRDTGKNIRKDDSVLLCTGEFIKADSDKIISLTTHKNVIYRAKQGNQSDIEMLKNSFFKPKAEHVYIPFDLANCKRVFPSQRIGEAMQYGYIEWKNSLQQGLNIDEPEDFTQNDYRAFKEHFNANIERNQIIAGYSSYDCVYSEDYEYNKDHCEIPENSDFFSGFVIKGFGRQFLLDNTTHPSLHPSERAMMAINGNGGLRWFGVGTGGAHDSYDRACVRLSELGFTTNFIVDIAIKVQKQQHVVRNKATRNNNGEILDYTTKVNDYKVSFLMTEDEKAFFGPKEKEHKKRLKEHNAWRDAILMKMKSSANHSEVVTLDLELHSKPIPAMRHDDRPIFMGWELEVIAKDAYRSDSGFKKIIKDIADSPFGDTVIIKRDSSIGSFGMELVSIPATLGYHTHQLDKYFFGIKYLFNKRLMSTETCGLHVHISKNCFTPLELGKFLAFVNAPENNKFINSVSGREPNAYCKKVALKGKNAHGINQSAKIAKTIRMNDRMPDVDRRVAVNIQNAKTIELRMFKSTTDQNNLIRKLQFCEALVKFARTHSLQQMTDYDFVNYVLANKQTYKNLIIWLGSKDYIGHERKHTSTFKNKKGELVKNRTKLIHVYSVNKIPKPKDYFRLLPDQIDKDKRERNRA